MTKDLDNLPYFTLSQLALFYKDKKNASVIAASKIRQKKIFSIREGVYISANKVLEISLSGKINSFKEFIATNIIYPPSYLSLEYILFENNIITENVYNFTLVTNHKTARFKNTFGMFIYKSIKKTLFGDYKIVKVDNLVIYKASLEKALFDYFYFKRGIIFSENYFKELRLNIENIDFKKFEKIVKKYKSIKLEKVFIILKKLKGL